MKERIKNILLIRFLRSVKKDIRIIENLSVIKECFGRIILLVNQIL